MRRTGEFRSFDKVFVADDHPQILETVIESIRRVVKEIDSGDLDNENSHFEELVGGISCEPSSSPLRREV